MLPFSSLTPDQKINPDLHSVRVFIATLDPGGSERVCVALCNGWVRRGIRVELLLVRATGAFLKELDAGVVVRDFAASRALRCFARVSRYLRNSEEAPLLVFGFHLAFGVLAAKQVGLHRTSVIYREGSAPLINTPVKWHWAYRFIIAKSKAIVAQNRRASSDLCSLGIPLEKIRIIPNPVFPKLAAGDGPVERLSNQNPLLISAGRLSPEKGFDRLIRAFKQWKAACPEAKLIIFGEGADRKRLEDLVKSLGLSGAVELPGFNRDLRGWYQRASLFVLSSHYEGQPNALMEAIAYSCPVLAVASGGGGVAELMEACGLTDSLVSETEFETGFSRHVSGALRQGPVHWNNARNKLLEFADPDKVVGAYLDACGTDAKVTQNVR